MLNSIMKRCISLTLTFVNIQLILYHNIVIYVIYYNRSVYLKFKL